jgi:triosephosphate isomerase (TIM)
MHGSRAFVTRYLQALDERLASHVLSQDTTLLLLPPHPYLDLTSQLLQGSIVKWGGQDVSEQAEEGAYTGDVSASMLRDLGCQYTLVGHSERRGFHQEDDVAVAAKFIVALQYGLCPILCIGESWEQRQQGLTEQVLESQLATVLSLPGDVNNFKHAIIAYEPIWAIGKGKSATTEQAQQIHRHIREFIAQYDPQIAQNLSILYGGSVKVDNARQLLAMPDIDGVLVGGASLVVEEFLGIATCSK